MTDRRRRPHRMTAVTLVAVTILAACGTSSNDFAVVDGIPITEDQALAYGPEAAAETSATAPAQDVRNAVAELIFDAAGTSAAASEFGFTVTEDDVDARLADPPDRWANLFDSASQDPAAGPGLLESLALRTLLLDAVGPELLVEEYGTWEALLEEAPDLVAAVCVRHIVTATEEEALAAFDRIEAGETFEAVAAEVSLDTANPGGLIAADSCPLPLSVSPEFTDAMISLEIGEVGGPVPSDSGFHVIRVEERVVPTAAELEEEAIAYVEAGSVSDLFSTWFTEAVQTADVEVASPIGTWSPDALAITPPGGSSGDTDDLDLDH